MWNSVGLHDNTMYDVVAWVIGILRELDQCIGKDKAVQDVKDAMHVVLQMLQEKEMEQVPSIEVLSKPPGKVSTLRRSPAKNRVANSPSKFPSKCSPRTSTRGSVKKTNCRHGSSASSSVSPEKVFELPELTDWHRSRRDNGKSPSASDSSSHRQHPYTEA